MEAEPSHLANTPSDLLDIVKDIRTKLPESETFQNIFNIKINESDYELDESVNTQINNLSNDPIFNLLPKRIGINFDFGHFAMYLQRQAFINSQSPQQSKFISLYEELSDFLKNDMKSVCEYVYHSHISDHGSVHHKDLVPQSVLPRGFHSSLMNKYSEILFQIKTKREQDKGENKIDPRYITAVVALELEATNSIGNIAIGYHRILDILPRPQYQGPSSVKVDQFKTIRFEYPFRIPGYYQALIKILDKIHREERRNNEKTNLDTSISIMRPEWKQDLFEINDQNCYIKNFEDETLWFLALRALNSYSEINNIPFFKWIFDQDHIHFEKLSPGFSGSMVILLTARRTNNNNIRLVLKYHNDYNNLKGEYDRAKNIIDSLPGSTKPLGEIFPIQSFRGWHVLTQSMQADRTLSYYLYNMDKFCNFLNMSFDKLCQRIWQNVSNEEADFSDDLSHYFPIASYQKNTLLQRQKAEIENYIPALCDDAKSMMQSVPLKSSNEKHTEFFKNLSSSIGVIKERVLLYLKNSDKLISEFFSNTPIHWPFANFRIHGDFHPRNVMIDETKKEIFFIDYERSEEKYCILLDFAKMEVEYILSFLKKRSYENNDLNALIDIGFDVMKNFYLPETFAMEYSSLPEYLKPIITIRKKANSFIPENNLENVDKICEKQYAIALSNYLFRAIRQPLIHSPIRRLLSILLLYNLSEFLNCINQKPEYAIQGLHDFKPLI